MNRFQIVLKGVGAGLLQNRMGDDELAGLRDKTRKKSTVATKPSLFDEAKGKIHVDGDGDPCIPAEMLMPTLINAGVFIRLDKKRQLSTAKGTLLPGLLTLEDHSYKLLEPSDKDISKWGLAPWRYDMRKGNNPNGAEAVAIVRPLFEKWAINVTCMLDTDELPEDTYRKLFDLGGSRVGLGDFRPARKGIFGMFTVVIWKNITGKTEKKAA